MQQGPPGSIADVIDRMVDISAALPVRDGVRAFNDMYLETTRQVGLAVADLVFTDAVFLDRLDVRFAELYFSALEAHDAGRGGSPRCWSALFDARSSADVHPLQFALAGMNAHISYDLPRALVSTVEELGGDLDDDSVRRDFLAVNQVLAQTQPLVKDVLLSARLAELDDSMGQVDDRVGMWAIEGAREMAWLSAQTLWALRGSGLRERYVSSLDRMVVASSRLILKF